MNGTSFQLLKYRMFRCDLSYQNLQYKTQNVDYLFIPSFFIKMLFLVDDFMVKIHIILKLYVALPFYI